MRLHELAPRPGAKHRTKRLGCGESSGHGKTSGKGHKGQKARSGGSIRLGFEGGQMPLYRRLPKRGFNNARFKKKIAIVNLSDLETLEVDGLINEAVLLDYGLIRGRYDGIKVLGEGMVSRRLQVEADAFSTSAREKIEAAGGTITVLERREASLSHQRRHPSRRKAAVRMMRAEIKGGLHMTAPPPAARPEPAPVRKAVAPVANSRDKADTKDLPACLDALAAWKASPETREASEWWLKTDVTALFRKVEEGRVPEELAYLNVLSAGIGTKIDKTSGRRRYCLRFRVLRRFTPGELTKYDIASLPVFDYALTDVVASPPLMLLNFPGKMRIGSFCRPQPGASGFPSGKEFFLTCEHVIDTDPTLDVVKRGEISRGAHDRSEFDAAVAVLPVPRAGIPTSVERFASLQIADVSDTDTNQWLGKFDTAGLWKTARISETRAAARVFLQDAQRSYYEGFFDQQIVLTDAAQPVFARPSESGTFLFLAGSQSIPLAAADSYDTSIEGRNRCCAMLIAGSTGRPIVEGFQRRAEKEEIYLASHLSLIQRLLRIEVIP